MARKIRNLLIKNKLIICRSHNFRLAQYIVVDVVTNCKHSGKLFENMNQVSKPQKGVFVMNLEQEIEVIVTDKQTAFLRATPEETIVFLWLQIGNALSLE